MRLHPAAVAALFVGGALLFHSTFPGLLGVDGFFHLAQARLMTEAGLAPDPIWMSHGALAGNWVDHHWGFHLLLMPFSGHGLLGGKLAASVFGGLSIWGLFLFLRARQAPWALAWALAPLALSWSFLFRIFTVRAMCISTGFLVAALHLALRGPAWAYFLLSLGWALSYQLAVLAVPIGLGAWLVPKALKVEGPSATLPLAGLAGFLLGLGVHPQAPRTFSFFWTHAVIGAGEAASHGTEWHPPVPGEFWMHGGALLVLVAALGLLVLRQRARLKADTVLLILGAAAGVVLTFKSMRFVEFGAPLLALAGGLMLRDWNPRRPRWTTALVGVLGLSALLVSARTAREARHPAPTRVADAGAWLVEHVPAGTRVHNVQWAWWPEWVFHAPHVAYTLGFDPNLLANYDPPRWDHFQKIRHGWYTNAGPALRGEFGAEYAVLGLPDPAAEALLSDPTLDVVFRSPGAAVLRVK